MNVVSVVAGSLEWTLPSSDPDMAATPNGNDECQEKVDRLVD